MAEKRTKDIAHISLSRPHRHHPSTLSRNKAKRKHGNVFVISIIGKFLFQDDEVEEEGGREKQKYKSSKDTTKMRRRCEGRKKEGKGRKAMRLNDRYVISFGIR